MPAKIIDFTAPHKRKTESEIRISEVEKMALDTELPTGKYTITEISNAEGYLPKTQVKTITVTKDATASAEFVNKVIVGNVTLTKVDEDYPENKLTGAVFTVYKSDKKTVVGTMKETETGVYSLEGLVYGEYYVQETKAPKYFVRDVNFYYFQIVNDGETVEVSNDELGNTDINKMYSDNEQIQKLKEVKTKMAQLMEQSVSEEKAMREQSVQKQAEQEHIEQAELQRQFEEAARDAQLSEHQNVLAEIGEEELIADYEIPTIDEFIG